MRSEKGRTGMRSTREGHESGHGSCERRGAARAVSSGFRWVRSGPHSWDRQVERGWGDGREAGEIVRAGHAAFGYGVGGDIRA